MNRPRLRILTAAVAFATVIAVGGCAATPAPAATTATVAPLPSARDTAIEPPRLAPALRLTDQDGQPFDLASLRGNPVIVYFGYTHCPDICPTTLADLRDAINLIGKPVRVIFVTVDPERDTASAMKQYVDSFKAGFTGLTGTTAEIATAAAAWGVSYARLDEQSANGYAMAHSTDAYLVDPAGKVRDRIYFGAPAALIAKLVTATLQ